MLWTDDPWFRENRSEARDAENAGDTARAEKLYRSLYEKAMVSAEIETIHEARLEWMHFLVFACRFEEAKLEGERFLKELGGSYPLVRAQVSVHLAGAAYYLNQYDEVINLSERNLSEDHGQYPARLRVEIFNQLALAERHQGQFEEAIEHFHEALLLTRREKLEDEGIYDGNVALVYEDQCRLLDALDSYQVALTKARKAKSEEITIFSLTGLGAIKHQLGLFGEARKALQEGLEKAEAMANSLMAQNLYVLLADLAREEGDLVEAMDYATAALLLAEQERIPESEAEARLAIGWVLLERKSPGDFEEALGHASRAAEIYTDLDLSFGLASAMALESQALSALGKSKDAVLKVKKTLQLAAQYGSRDERLYFSSGEVLAKAGFEEEALQQFTKARMQVNRKAQEFPIELRDRFLSRPDISKILHIAQAT